MVNDSAYAPSFNKKQGVPYSSKDIESKILLSIENIQNRTYSSTERTPFFHRYA